MPGGRRPVHGRGEDGRSPGGDREGLGRVRPSGLRSFLAIFVRGEGRTREAGPLPDEREGHYPPPGGVALSPGENRGDRMRRGTPDGEGDWRDGPFRIVEGEVSDHPPRGGRLAGTGSGVAHQATEDPHGGGLRRLGREGGFRHQSGDFPPVLPGGRGRRGRPGRVGEAPVERVLRVVDHGAPAGPEALPHVPLHVDRDSCRGTSGSRPCPPLLSVLPFAGLLLSIALFPLFASRFWARHFGKVSLAFGLPVAAWFLIAAPGELWRTALEYVSFLVLLGSLFTISGGILLKGTIRGTPAVNCTFLGVGAVIANLLRTTGAAMLLIRPLLRANQGRGETVPHHHLLHLRGGQHRGAAYTDRGPSPVPRVPQGGAVLLDGRESVAPLAGHGGHGNRGLLPVGPSCVPGGRGRGTWTHPGREWTRAPLIRGIVELPSLRGGDRGGLPSDAVEGGGDGGGNRRVGVEDPRADPEGEPVLLPPDQGGGHPVRGDLRDDDPRPVDPFGPRRGAGGGPAVALLLGGGDTVELPGQRPHVSDLFQSRAGPSRPGGRGGDLGAGPEGDQRGVGLHGGELLHRQRPELHGQGDRGGLGSGHAVLFRVHDVLS